MSAGEYIKKKRLEKGMSQRQLSVVSGVSNSEISRIEAGKRQNPSPPVLRAIAKALDIPYEELLAEAGYLRAGAVDESARLPEWVYKLPPDLYEFIREESSRGWPYMRLAKGLRRKDLDPAELEAIVKTWMQAKKRYERGPGRKD
jgi:transcriptional regulator with XRE-family HTH domain